METDDIKKAAKMKALELAPRIIARGVDVAGLQNELALGLREFIEDPEKEIRAHEARLAEQEKKIAAKKQAKLAEKAAEVQKVEDLKQAEAEAQERKVAKQAEEAEALAEATETGNSGETIVVDVDATDVPQESEGE